MSARALALWPATASSRTTSVSATRRGTRPASPERPRPHHDSAWSARRPPRQLERPVTSRRRCGVDARGSLGVVEGERAAALLVAGGNGRVEALAELGATSSDGMGGGRPRSRRRARRLGGPGAADLAGPWPSLPFGWPQRGGRRHRRRRRWPAGLNEGFPAAPVAEGGRDAVPASPATSPARWRRRAPGGFPRFRDEPRRGRAALDLVRRPR